MKSDAEPLPATQRSLERRLLAVLFVLLGLSTAWLILSRRLPRGHDTLMAYVIQYLFVSHSAQGAGIPFWLPYSAHGYLTNLFVGTGGGFVQTSLLLVGVPAGASMLTIFHLGMLFEEILLLVGTWRLGGHFYRSPYARFLVTASVVGSSFWAEQIWHNHRAIYAVPLILSFFHAFLETGRRRHLFLAVNLLLLQFLGNAFYTVVLTGLVILLYLVVYAVVFRGRLRANWPELRPRPLDALLLLANVALLGCFYLTFTSGSQQIPVAHTGRNPDGTVSLTQFLTFAGGLHPVRYLDLVLGIGPVRDFTLFFGVAAVPLAILGAALRPGKTALHFSACLVLVFFLSLGYLSCIAAMAYAAVPPLRFYRYLCVSAVHVRIPLLFLAGLGIEGLLRSGPGDARLLKRTALALGILGLLTGLLSTGYWSGRSPAFDVPLLVRTPTPTLAGSAGSEDPRYLAGILTGTCLVAFALAGALWLHARRPRWGAALAVALVLVQTADLARWRIQLTRDRTGPLTDEQQAVQAIAPLPYVPRRAPVSAEDPRARTMMPDFFDSGAMQDTVENYFHRDPPASPFTSVIWMPSLDLLLRAYTRTPLDGAGGALPTVWRRSVRPPYGKLIGLEKDKLQVFAKAHPVDGDDRMAALLNRAEFQGDVLLIAEAGAGASPPIEANERLDVPCRVESFDANGIRVRVAAPNGAWLYYSDAWHPDWTATVNGRQVPVSRAFLAYKAVPLYGGENLVEFRMVSPVRLWTFRVLAINAALWVLGVLALAVGCFRPGRNVSRKGTAP